MAKLANFEVTFELKELKIHVKGDREIAPSIANNVGRQFANVFSPAGLIEGPKDGHSANGNEKVIEAEVVASPRRRKRGAIKPAAGTAESTSTTWSHDLARWGAPSQTWKISEKCAWLLYVVEQATGKKELGPTEIAETFKANFRDIGLLRPSNISRDLAKLDTLFGSDQGRWFLKQAGKEVAEKLIAGAKIGTATAA